ncbi:hypothetical protein [Flagellimonas sp. 2504JD1-5]
MKTITKSLTLVIMVLSLLVSSCREEEFMSEGSRPEESLQADSSLTNLLLRTAMNDGSADNIIDNASCLLIELPVTVIVNGSEVVVNTPADYNVIEGIFEQNEDDTDTLEIVFPVNVIFSDHTMATVSTVSELDGFKNGCPGENAQDDDIECVDISYPITFSIFNTINEAFNTMSMSSDKDLFEFVTMLKSTDIVNVEFPVSVLLSDGTELEAMDLDELEGHIDSYKDDCDEDDNNDFDDDDCTDCSTNKLGEIFATCDEWLVDSFIKNNSNIQDQYSSFAFNFLSDGALTVSSTTETLFGTWSASGSGNSTQLVISVLGLDDFNGSWDINEIAQTNSQGKVNLRLGNDRLRLDNACLSNTKTGNIPLGVVEQLTNGSWTINSYMEGDTDKTADFNGYSLTFNMDGNVIADNGTPINGTWTDQNTLSILEMNFGSSSPFDTLNNVWKAFSVTDNTVKFNFTDPQEPDKTRTLVLLKP